MTFAGATRASRTSRPARRPGDAGSSPFAAPVHKQTRAAPRAALPDAHGRSPADSRVSAPPLVHQALATHGEPLESSVRFAMEQRFGRDFRHVRVHTGETAAASARAVDAHAYAVGEHLVFNRDRYAPDTVSGRRLLAHELAHVVQNSRSHASGQGLFIDPPGSAAEQSADLALQPRINPAALSARLASTAPSEPVLHRAIATWGGTWDMKKYDDVVTGGTKNGLDIELHFKPGPSVDASMIGIVQKAQVKSAGAAAFPDATVQGRAVPAGKPGEGSFIDRISSARNPLYPTQTGVAGNKLWDAPTTAFWGQHGFRHVDAKGVVSERDAIVKDTPTITPVSPNSEEVFEDTALAVTGVQTGANYGSVQWGWKTDAAGNFTKLPLTVLSQTVPTAAFIQAEAMWNKSKNDAGEDLIKFYSASEKFVQADNTSLVSNPSDAANTEIAKLAQNTRIEVIDYGVGQKFNLANPADKWVKITITDGPSVGKTGWVKSSQVARTKVKAGPASARP